MKSLLIIMAILLIGCSGQQIKDEAKVIGCDRWAKEMDENCPPRPDDDETEALARKVLCDEAEKAYIKECIE